MIHTASYFEDWNFGKKGRLVSIALEMPDWFTEHYSDREVVVNEKLQPTWHLVSSRKARIMSPDQYKKIYHNLLRDQLIGNWLDLLYGRQGPKKALELLELKDGDTLLCWEKHGLFCHRKIVAELLIRNKVNVSRK